jgi:hypothetical protein
MPHLAAEGGWLTTFTFVNKSASAQSTRTNLFTPTGSALPLPIALPEQTAINGDVLASSLDQTIAANAQFVMQATGPANVAYAEGSAQLNATGAVDGFAIFHYNPNNQEAVVPMETRNAASYILPFDNEQRADGRGNRKRSGASGEHFCDDSQRRGHTGGHRHDCVECAGAHVVRVVGSDDGFSRNGEHPRHRRIRYSRLWIEQRRPD